MKRRRPDTSAGGYILLEAVVGLALLSIAAYAVHGTLRQALETRGQAQDYTRVRFLLEELLAQEQLQPFSEWETRSGVFPAPNDRFRYTVAVAPVEVPKPPPRPQPPGAPEFDFHYQEPYLVHLKVSVTWERFGRTFSESLETLFQPTRMPLNPDELSFGP